MVTDPFAPLSHDAWDSELVASLPFEIDLQYAFQRQYRINFLEAQSRLSLSKLLARSPKMCSMRHLICQDSRVNIGACSKSRSSSKRLNHILTEAAAYELATNSQYGILWVDSFRMPADAPTREGGVSLPSPAHPSVSAFLGGSPGALDERLGTHTS